MKDDLRKCVAYPLYPSKTWLERVMRHLKFGGIAWCPVCGSITLITKVGDNLRETCRCLRCKSTNRQRQLAIVVCRAAGVMTGQKMTSLRDVAGLEDFVVYNTEAGRQIHDRLSTMKNYRCSEYFGDEHRSGDIVGGRVHQDLMNLTFDDRSIDLVISSDVFEHIPDPYRAHKEVYRVLRKGGRHVFTVPFLQTEFLDDARTVIDLNGNIIFLKDPIHHGDPIRPEGALVHKIFSLEMLVNLRKIGFRTNLYRLYKPSLGIIGANALVFEAMKE
jgi:SAM-dependent methyltransferase